MGLLELRLHFDGNILKDNNLIWITWVQCLLISLFIKRKFSLPKFSETGNPKAVKKGTKRTYHKKGFVGKYHEIFLKINQDH